MQPLPRKKCQNEPDTPDAENYKVENGKKQEEENEVDWKVEYEKLLRENQTLHHQQLSQIKSYQWIKIFSIYIYIYQIISSDTTCNHYIAIYTNYRNTETNFFLFLNSGPMEENVILYIYIYTI